MKASHICVFATTLLGSPLLAQSTDLKLTPDVRVEDSPSLPAENRHSHLSEGNLFTPKDPLLKSGLIGPVLIRQSK